MDNRNNIPTRAAAVALAAATFRTYANRAETKTDHALSLRARAEAFERKLAREMRGNPQTKRVQPTSGIAAGDAITDDSKGLTIHVVKVKFDGRLTVANFRSALFVGTTISLRGHWYLCTGPGRLKPIQDATAKKIMASGPRTAV